LADVDLFQMERRAMNIKANHQQRRDLSGDDEQEIGGGRELERLIFFSDAVFAIAITLLVLDIRVPSLSQDVVATELPNAIAALWPKFLSYIISFVVIGLYCWQVHHRTFRYITNYDDRLVALNLVLLMGVAFLPFSVSLISTYGSQQIALLIYLGHLGAIGLLLDALLLTSTLPSDTNQPTVPNAVRIYNYILGGSYYEPVDQAAAEYMFSSHSHRADAHLSRSLRLGGTRFAPLHHL
jgi:uncharacterized membrane protein